MPFTHARKVLLHSVMALAAALALISGALAAQISIASYDVEQTPVSGFGCWNHTFTGAVTDTGRTVSGSVICSPDGIGHVLNYANGNGTLNDGLLDAAHLLLTRADDAGVPLEPVIRLRLNQAAKVDEIRLLATGFTTINSVTVEINGMAIPFTPAAINGDPLNVSISLQGSGLALAPAQMITLKGFTAIFYGTPIDQFGISEIQIVGTPTVNVPALNTQCKAEGWRSFNFRNQGQCVRFVESSPRAPR